MDHYGALHFSIKMMYLSSVSIVSRSWWIRSLSQQIFERWEETPTDTVRTHETVVQTVTRSQVQAGGPDHNDYVITRMKLHSHYLLRARVAAQREVGDHFLVRKFISFRALDHAIQHQDVAIGLTADNRRNTVK